MAGIFLRSPGVICYDKWVFSEGGKNSRIGVPWTYNLSIFNQFKFNELRPFYRKHVEHNFEWHNSLKLSFMNIWGLPSNFVGCDSINFGNFSVKGYFPLIWKDSSTHMHGLTLYVQDVSLENSADSYLCFRLTLLHCVLLLFPI